MSIQVYLQIHVTYIYIYIRHRAQRVGRDWVLNSAFRLLQSDSVAPIIRLAYIRATPSIRTVEIRNPPPPWAASEYHWFCYSSVLIINISLTS